MIYRGKLVQIREQNEQYIMRVRNTGVFYVIDKLTKDIIVYADMDLNVDEITRKLMTKYNLSFYTAYSYVVIVMENLKSETIGYPLEYSVSTPLRVSWRVTKHCNLTCKHCYAECGPNINFNDLSTEQCLAIINKLDEGEIFEVAITGGEPFNRGDIKIILEELSKRKFDICVFTNATLINNNIDYLLNLPIRRFNISIDGFEKEHDSLRGNGAFKRAMDGINLLKNNGKKIIINCVINSLNVENISQIAQMFFDNEIEYQFSLITPLGSTLENMNLLPNAEQYKKAIESIKEIILKNKKEGYILDSSRSKIIKLYDDNTIEEEDDVWSCNAANTKFDIDYNGDVYYCPFSNASMVGNILDKNVLELWNNPYRNKFLNYIRSSTGHLCNPIKNIINQSLESYENYELFQ